MNNIFKGIFKGAKFGDKFVTRDGQIALLRCVHIGNDIIDEVSLITPFNDILVDNTGKVLEFDDIYSEYHTLNEDNNFDIVSRYQEHINENKLDELANEFADKESIPFSRRSDIDSFKAGYRKAMEE